MQQKQRRINIFISTFLVLLSTLASILINLASNELPPGIRPYLPLSWLLLIIVTFAVIILTILQSRGQLVSDPLSSTLTSQHRRQLLRDIRTIWISGFLEKSLHGAALITLGLQKKPDVVAISQRFLLQQSDQLLHPLPLGTDITQIYEESGRQLLILGEPGSGKTTLLLELTRYLLEYAERDPNEPIPIVFLLSAWATKQQSLAVWLVDEMQSRYHIPSRIGQTLINTGQVLPLLDGLDEVASTYREECIKKINDYQQKQKLGMVICSRSADYLTQKTKVRLRTAVVVQPLTTQEIENYLTSAGGELAKLRVALPKDAVLRELIATPLMLSVLTLAYHSIPLTDILKPSTLEIRRRKVFATYVEQMLIRRKVEARQSQRQSNVASTRGLLRNNPHYAQQQTVHWLTWLAQQLALHNRTEFSVSQMKEDWLPEGQSRRFYEGFATGLQLGFVPAAAVQISFGLIFGVCFGAALERGAEWGSGMAFALTMGLGAIALFVVGFMLWWMAELSSRWVTELVSTLKLIIRTRTVTKLVFTLGLIIGTPAGLVASLGTLIISLVVGLSFGWMSGLISSLMGSVTHIGLFDGGAGVLIVVLIVLGAIGVFIMGSDSLEPPPIFMPLFWIVEFFGFGKTHIERFIVRLLLWRTGNIPWNYSRFLGFASERILLRKVGRSYIFVHQLLLDYFATSRWKEDGDTYYITKHYDKALAVFEAASRFDPNNVLAFASKGKVLYCLKRYEEALAAYEQALRLDPRSAEAQAGKGEALTSLNRNEEAVAAFEQAMKLDPNYKSAYNNILERLNEVQIVSQSPKMVRATSPTDRSSILTERARKVLNLSVEEAQYFQHNYVGTEHLLLGLLREDEGVAAKVLKNLGVELNKVRSAIELIIGRGDTTTGEIGFSPRARKVIELAVDEAHSLNHEYLDTEHLLLGLVHEGEGIAIGLLESLGVNWEQVRADTFQMLDLYSKEYPLSLYSTLKVDQHDRESLDKFSKCATTTVGFAVEEARHLKCNRVSTEHLLLGLLHERECGAAKVLRSLGVELNETRRAVEVTISRGRHTILNEIKLAPSSKRVIAAAVAEAGHLNHSHVDTEHLLLGLIQERESISAGLLESMGINLEEVRTKVIQALSQEDGA